MYAPAWLLRLVACCSLQLACLRALRNIAHAPHRPPADSSSAQLMLMRFYAL
jgi:hypothetical protein